MKIVLFSDKKKLDRKTVGGKGHNLLQLVRWGMNVPPFAILSPKFLDRYEKKSELVKDILKQVVSEIGQGPYAVRSSMSFEDGREHSFAGMMDSFLNVPFEKLEETINLCASSLLKERVVRYRERKKIHEKIKAAVIVQKMVLGDISGVAFSRSPRGNSALTYIESSYGLGSGVVSGEVSVDAFWSDRFGKIISNKIVKKDKMVTCSASGTEQVDVSVDRINLPSLTKDQVKEINRVMLEIEERMKHPCDIEWTYADDTLYILQARPITQKFPPLRYYVDTTLSESYPGKTTPMTGSFVERAFTKIFKEAIQRMTMSWSLPRQLSPYFSSMVSYVGGHLYYNLTSYYAILMALPGGKVNIENWHRMNGGQPDKQLDLSAYYRPGLFIRLKIIFSITFLVIFHRQIFEDFYQHADSALDGLNRKLSRSRRSKEFASLLIWALKTVKGFSLTVLNDLLIMGTLELLSKSLKRKGYSQAVLGEIIHTDELVESIKARQELDELFKLLLRDSSALESYKRKLDLWDGVDYQQFYDELFRENQSIWSHKMRDYLNKYGNRSFEELKLESMSFSQDPQGFYEFLKWNLKIKYVGMVVEPQERKQIDVKRMGIIFRTILALCRKFISTREHCRLTRGNFFGWIRTAFLKFAQAVKQEERELFADITVKDFFYLTYDDLESFIGYTNYPMLRETILARKAMDRNVETYPEFFCHPAGTDDEPYFFSDQRIDLPQAELGTLRGLGASKGVVQGEALVISSPFQAMQLDQLDDKILVAKNADPAWIFIMGQCRGLVSEKGSLLAHSAIIGRELGIPTVVGVREATQKIINGVQIEIDGTEGTIRAI